MSFVDDHKAGLLVFVGFVLGVSMLAQPLAIRASTAAGSLTPAPVVERVVVAAPEPQPPRDPLVEQVEAEFATRLQGATDAETREVSAVLVAEARAAGFDPWFIVAIIEAESDFKVEACSPAGALGLMQMLPSTFRSVSDHRRVTDPVANVSAGIEYLRRLHASGFTWPSAILRAYNAGPGAASAYYRAIYRKQDTSGFSAEMKEYPGRVLAKYARLLKRNGQDVGQADKLWRLGRAEVASR